MAHNDDQRTPLPDHQTLPEGRLPFFLHREPPNRIEDHVWGRHIRAYLDYSVKTCGVTRHALMVAAGYAKSQKFEKHRRQWHDLSRPIPKGYLSAIGVNLPLLDDVVELDRCEFAQVLALPRCPRSYVVKLLPAVYQHRPLPEGIAEDEAVEILAHTAREEKRIAWIHYPELLTITAGRTGNVSRREYWPELHQTRCWIYFADRGLGLGSVSIGGRRV